MAEETTVDQAEFEGFSIDPSTWVEPTQEFPGQVKVSRYKWANDAYKAATPFRPQITEPLPQWDLQVKRLDASLLLPDGSKADAIRYGGIDLKKYSKRVGGLVPISAVNAKEYFIMESWKGIAGTIEPPTRLEQMNFMFTLHLSKKFGGPTPSKNVLVPTSVLPPDYTYDGEVQVFQVQAREGDSQGDQGPTESSAPTTLLGEDEAWDKLADILVGTNANETAKLLQGLPAEMRLPPIMSGLATDKAVKRLVDEGLLYVQADGTIQLTSDQN